MDKDVFDDFFSAKPIQFSETWKAELVTRLKRLIDKNMRHYIGSVHDAMIQEMVDAGKHRLRGKFPMYKVEDIEDISHDAFIKWYSSFNATKANNAENPEEHWFLICIETAQIVWYYKQSPTINVEVKLDDNSNPVLDEKGKEKFEKIKASFVSFPENINDNPDDSEESEPKNNTKTDSEKISSLAALESADIENKEAQNGFFEFAGKRFSNAVRDEAIKYYLLSGRVKTNAKQNTLPISKAVYKPLKKSIPYQVRPEFDNLSDASVNALNMLQYLKNAEKRKWMEMAIGEMKKSIDKLNSFIISQKKNNPAFDEIKFRQNTPILSSIAIDNNGNHVASCFKGQVTTHSGKRDLTFDKHCEFSLFTDIIGEHNLHLVTDGVLYVTLEPCNKRGFWLDGDKKKPKIPCAVRCVEAGLKKIYIGSLDDNKDVYKKGKEILESGKFIFPIENGYHIGSSRQIEAAKLLEEYFIAKKIPCERLTDKIVYQIGKPIEVHDFEADLIEEVRKLNAEFLQRHCPNQFRL